MTNRLLVLVCFAALWSAPAVLRAQTAWDSPLLLPPRAAAGFGLFLTDMHRGGIGLLGTWQSPVWNYGVRAGISEGPAGSDLAVFGGIDYTGIVNRGTDDFPVDIDWVFGLGAALSDYVHVGVPLGLSAGHTFQGEGARFTPYLTPRVVLDAWFGRDVPANGNGAELDLAIDLGLDLAMAAGAGPFGGATIRFAVTLGDRAAIGLGLVF
jgi:hypothetical protein